MHDAVELEKKGKPTITFVTSRFELLAKTTCRNLGMPDLQMVVIPHPIGGIDPKEVVVKTDGVFDKVLKLVG